MNFALYSETGRIESIVGSFFGAVQCDEIDPSSHYVDVVSKPHTLRQKKNLDIEISKEGLFVKIGNLPEGTSVFVGGGVLLVDELCEAEIEFDLPGIYSVEIEPPPRYLSEELEVTVGDA